LYGSLNIIMIMSVRRWAGHVARMRDDKCIQSFGRRTGREENSEDLGVDGRVILEWTLGK